LITTLSELAPCANIIVVTPFYHAQLTKVGDDNQFLKTAVWPQLTGFFGSADKADFEIHFPQLRLHESDILDQEKYEKGYINGDLQSLQGEGTCGPSGPTCMVSPYLASKHLFNFVTCFMCNPSGR
jgi:hypothetical protein